MKKIARLCGPLVLFFAVILILPISSSARNTATMTDCYLKDYQSGITVNTDSSLDITEKITMDCGNVPNKHGLFRILPTWYQKTSSQKVTTPIKLISITDFNNTPVKYTETKNSSDGTVTWKIGDPNRTVTGINYYLIKYHADNSIRFDSPNFDEFYWNLNGNFWTMETDNFVATINFPPQVDLTNSEINLYSGAYTVKNAGLAKYEQNSPNTLVVSSLQTLGVKTGITVSATVPKNIFTPYKFTAGAASLGFIESGGFWFFLPLLAFIIAFFFWKKYGQDIKINKVITPEFDVPGKLAPLKYATFINDGKMDTKHISAAIIGFATKGLLKIEEIPKKGIFSSRDVRLTMLADQQKISSLGPEDQLLINGLFGGDKEILISDLKNKFYKKISGIKDKVKDELVKADLFSKQGFTYVGIFAAVGGVCIAIGFFLGSVGPYFMTGMIASGIIFFIFSALMPRRTEAGAELFWQTKGFKMYMDTAEKYRQKFNEKENIFERFLPYAMIYGIVGLWVKKMKMLYGEDYFNNYAPIWYVGYMGNFDINSFDTMLSGISHDMAATMASAPSSSGSGGGGFSGGGGGGGGGGSW